MKELFGGKSNSKWYSKLYTIYRVTTLPKQLIDNLFPHSCCQSDRQAIGIPVRCFERNGCVGLHWLAEDACSTKYRDSIEAKINKLKTESAVEKKQNELVSRGI